MPDHAAGNDWLFMYLDVMTLLLCLFVVLMAYASFAQEEYTELTKSLSNAVAVQGEVKKPVQAVVQREKTQAAVEAPAKREAEQLREEFRRTLQQQGLQDTVELSLTTNRINLLIGERILFELARAGLTPEGQTVLAQLVPLLMVAKDHTISIEGHTDSVPIANEQFPSNWELSVHRATVVLRFLASQGVDDSRMRAIGYADTQPLEANDSPAGRARNRRVSLVLHMPEE